jgi:hypothetical protein
VVFCEPAAPLRIIVNWGCCLANQYRIFSASVFPRSKMATSDGLSESVTSYTWNLNLVTILPGIVCLVTKSVAGFSTFWYCPVNRNVRVSLSCFKDMNCPGNLSFCSSLTRASLPYPGLYVLGSACLYRCCGFALWFLLFQRLVDYSFHICSKESALNVCI